MKNADTWIEEGDEHCKMQDWKHAIECYKKALEIQPGCKAKHAIEAIMNILSYNNRQIFDV